MSHFTTDFPSFGGVKQNESAERSTANPEWERKVQYGKSVGSDLKVPDLNIPRSSLSSTTKTKTSIKQYADALYAQNKGKTIQGRPFARSTAMDIAMSEAGKKYGVSENIRPSYGQ